MNGNGPVPAKGRAATTNAETAATAARRSEGVRGADRTDARGGCPVTCDPQDRTDAAFDLLAAASAVAADRAPARRLLALADLSDQAAALAGHVSAGRLPRRHVVTALSAAAAVAGIAAGAAERVVVGALDQEGG